MKQYPVAVRLTIIMIFLILSVYVIIIAKQILYPIALSVLCAYLLFPIASFLEKRLRFPRVIAVIISVLIFIAIITGAIQIISHQIQKFLHDDVLREQAVENFAEIQMFLESKFGWSSYEQKIWFNENLEGYFEAEGKMESVISKLAHVIEAVLFIPIFTIFMLFYRDRAETFIHKLAKRRHAELAEHLIKQISQVTIKYVTGVTIVVIILAIVHSTVLSIIGIKYAVVLGIIAACFSFIPYFGTIISGILPVSFTLFAEENPYLAIAVIAYYVIISLIDHNILTPSIVGGNVHLNPFITILSIIVGAMIWGIPGMIIVVPFMAVVKIVCDNVEDLKPVGYILGVEKGGLTIRKIAGFFMRKPNQPPNY
ncbi:MAG: AI-2E family transporter [Ignavibacteriaceae bacterium]|jgi:predicted PurR-regulated permease PerM|nr:AI-2E family transporter [Ignavibacteriaceae bacterium]